MQCFIFSRPILTYLIKILIKIYKGNIVRFNKYFPKINSNHFLKLSSKRIKEFETEKRIKETPINTNKCLKGKFRRE